MSQVIRAEDLEAGVMFDVAALGTVPLGQTSTIADVLGLQKPIRELYLNYQKPSGAQPLPACRLVVSNRGLAVTDAPTGPQDRTPSAETLYNIPSVVFAAAVKFLVVGKKERDFRCAFEAIDSEGPPPKLAKGKNDKNDLYVAIDKKWKHLTKVTSHPSICACVIQRMTAGVKASELHAFVCESDLQARDVIFCLTSALRNFRSKDLPAPVSSPAIYGHGPYDILPQPAVGGMRNESEYMMSQQLQQQGRPSGPAEGVYGFQGHPDQMMGHRGADMMGRPGGMSGPVGGQWDARTLDGRPPAPGSSDGQQGSDWLSNQRDQLMRNFSNDQRKNEPLRGQAEQSPYDLQRGVYDINPSRGIYDLQPSRGIYDTQPSKGIYDTQPSKGTYDTQAAIYEYRPPQSHGEPPREAYGQGPTADPYTLRRDIYDPQMTNRAQGDPGNGNLYGPMRTLSGSSERVFDEPRIRGQDPPPKFSYDAPSRTAGESYGGGGPPAESEYSKGFALPRVKVNYDGEAQPGARSGELVPPGGGGEYSSGGRPLSIGHDSGRLQRPVSPLPQAKAKAQPPAPLAKTRPSGQGSTTDANPGLRSAGGGGPGPMSADQGDSSVPAQAKKVRGIKVFPTIMLRPNQAAAAAAADEAMNGDSTGRQPPKDVARKPYTESSDDQHGGADRSFESAFGGLTVDPGKANRKSVNDFEQSLGYLP